MHLPPLGRHLVENQFLACCGVFPMLRLPLPATLMAQSGAGLSYHLHGHIMECPWGNLSMRRSGEGGSVFFLECFLRREELLLRHGITSGCLGRSNIDGSLQISDERIDGSL